MMLQLNGAGENTYQTQICHQRKYLEGTYVVRCFNDEAVSGDDGDEVVETFYMITPYDKPFDPDYSEMDFEYSPQWRLGRLPDNDVCHNLGDCSESSTL